VATWMAKSLTMRSVRERAGVSWTATSVTGIFLPCSGGSSRNRAEEMAINYSRRTYRL
jgi:hypothetical protein